MISLGGRHIGLLSLCALLLVALVGFPPSPSPRGTGSLTLSAPLDAPSLHARTTTGMVRLEGHKDSVTWVGFSPDGRTLVSTGQDRRVRVWDLSGKAPSTTLDAKGRTPFTGAIAPDGRKVAALMDNFKTVQVWDLPSGEARETTEIERPRQLQFTPEGHLLALVNGGFELWDVDLSKARASRVFERGSPAMAMSGDCRTVAFERRSGVIGIWEPDIQTLRELRDRESAKGDLEIVCLALSGDGKTLASGRSGLWTSSQPGTSQPVQVVRGVVQVWDVATGKEPVGLEASEVELDSRSGKSSMVCGVAITEDGKLVAALDRTCTLRLWDARTGRLLACVANLPAGPLPYHDPVLAFSANGKKLAVGGSEGRIDFVDTATGQIRAVAYHPGGMEAGAISPNGRFFAARVGALNEFSSIMIWDVATGTELGSFPNVATGSSLWFRQAPSFSSNSKTLASGDERDNVVLWDIASRRGARFPWVPRIEATAISGDGKTLAASAGNQVRCWNIASGREHSRTPITVSQDVCSNLALSADAKILLTVSDCWELQTWDMARRKQMARWQDSKFASVALAPNGKVVATGQRDGIIRVWDSETGNLRATLQGHTGSVFWLAFSSYGRQLSSQSMDGTMKRWDLTTAKELSSISAKGDPPSAGYFTPDGKTIIRSTWMGSIQVLDVPELIISSR